MRQEGERGWHDFLGETPEQVDFACRETQREAAALDALAKGSITNHLLKDGKEVIVLKFLWASGIKTIVLTEGGFRKRFEQTRTVTSPMFRSDPYRFVSDPVGISIDGEIVASTVGNHHSPRTLYLGLADYIEEQLKQERYDLTELYEPVRRFATWLGS